MTESLLRISPVGIKVKGRTIAYSASASEMYFGVQHNRIISWDCKTAFDKYSNVLLGKLSATWFSMHTDIS